VETGESELPEPVPVTFISRGLPKNACAPESAGDLWGRQLPGCLQKCDFWQMVRLLALRENRPLTENEIGTLLLTAAIDVHRELGPGLL